MKRAIGFLVVMGMLIGSTSIVSAGFDNVSKYKDGWFGGTEKAKVTLSDTASCGTSMLQIWAATCKKSNNTIIGEDYDTNWILPKYSGQSLAEDRYDFGAHHGRSKIKVIDGADMNGNVWKNKVYSRYDY